MQKYFFSKIILILIFYTISFSGFSQDTTQQKEKVNPKTIIQSYIKTLIGDNKLKKFKSLVIEYRVNLENTKINIKKYWKFPNKFAKVMKGNDTIFIEKRIVNAEEGMIITPERKGKIYDLKLNKVKEELDFIPEVQYLKNENYKLTLEGMEIMHGKLSYKIKIKLPNGLQRVEYYNSENHYKARTVAQEIHKNDTLEVITDYGNYLELKEVENMIYPHRVTKTFNGKSYIYFLISFKLNPKIKNKIFDID